MYIYIYVNYDIHIFMHTRWGAKDDSGTFSIVLSGTFFTTVHEQF